MVESANVKIDDLKLRQVTPQNISTYDDKSDGKYHNEEFDEEPQENELDTDDEDDEETSLPKSPSKRVKKSHPENWIIGDKNAGVEIRRKLTCDSEQAMLSLIEPKSVKESRKIKDWIKAMDEELDQIEKNQTWELVPIPKYKNVVGTK
jgi:hypothetical protein